MNRDTALEIIKNEELRNYNWFNEHDIMPNEVSIGKNSGSVYVFTSDERCSRISEIMYTSESEALIDFIKRLRADKILRSL